MKVSTAIALASTLGIVLGFLLSNKSHAEERLQVAFGPDLTGTAYGSIAYQSINDLGLIQQSEICFYRDNRLNSKNSGNVSTIGCGFYSLGVEVGNDSPVYMQALGGIGAATHTDYELATKFPLFHGEVNFGYQDTDTGNRIGLQYVHTSDGNMTMPNYGKDSFVLTASIPL